MPPLSGSRALPLLAALALCACGGPPLTSREEAATSLTRASFPSTRAQGAAMRLSSSHLVGNNAVPEAAFSLQGRRGGSATVKVSPVELAVGLAGKGLLLDVQYADYSEDGVYRLDGRLSILARFDYVAAPGEDPAADLKLSLVGRVRLSGVYSDELRARLSLVTRLHPLSLQEGEVAVRLDGYVEASQGRFEFSQDDFTIAWGEGSRP